VRLTAKKDGSSRHASKICARSTRLARSVRDRAIETNLTKSSAPIDNSIARRQAVMTFHPAPPEVRVQEIMDRVNPAQNDQFHGIDELDPPAWINAEPKAFA
jgi:hypothetical protein